MGDINEFIAITGAGKGDAEKFLEAAGGDLQEAIELFYAEGASSGAAATASAPAHAARSGPPPSKPAGRSTRASGMVRGLGDLNADNDDDDDEEEDFNDYYVGGEKSGQLVRGAPKKPKDPNAVEGLFESARRAGAEEYRPSEHQPQPRGSRAFGGRARTLAGGSVEPEGENVAGGEGDESSQERAVTIAFYRNGVFTIDDGEPRDMSDPSNFPFMEAIARGQMPTELDPGDPNIQLNVSLVRKDEDYAPPAKPKQKAFTGTGQKLGASTDGDTSVEPPPAAPPAATPPGSLSWEGADPEKPKTSIQLRLSDGSRMVAEFNLSHTVGDIRRFLHASRPDMNTAFRLMTAFPSAQLTDDGATIESAGLANSVIIQKA